MKLSPRLDLIVSRRSTAPCTRRSISSTPHLIASKIKGVLAGKKGDASIEIFDSFTLLREVCGGDEQSQEAEVVRGSTQEQRSHVRRCLQEAGSHNPIPRGVDPTARFERTNISDPDTYASTLEQKKKEDADLSVQERQLCNFPIAVGCSGILYFTPTDLENNCVQAKVFVLGLDKSFQLKTRNQGIRCCWTRSGKDVLELKVYAEDCGGGF
ncbi:30S ribosomal protein S7 [Striga asiatica]|uniref:30S ribosomal protein S7 n=1 Tax=Striga asiatica TaxID=4170 RepID=A0A5A7QGB9_STRAF|nr:30S ribosomal protein S7 [Striga asiatica]